MNSLSEDPDFDSGGYDVDDWSRLKAFTGRVATLDDVQAKRAVFALDDTQRPFPLDMDLPQPVIWWEEDGEQAAVWLSKPNATPATKATRWRSSA